MQNKLKPFLIACLLRADDPATSVIREQQPTVIAHQKETKEREACLFCKKVQRQI